MVEERRGREVGEANKNVMKLLVRGRPEADRWGGRRGGEKKRQVVHHWVKDRALDDAKAPLLTAALHNTINMVLPVAINMYFRRISSMADSNMKHHYSSTGSQMKTLAPISTRQLPMNEYAFPLFHICIHIPSFSQSSLF